MCPLSTLPDLCLLGILDRVPVHNLYHTVPLVCKRWASLHDTACHRRQTLILVGHQDYLSRAVDRKFICFILKYAIRDDGTPYQDDETIPSNLYNSCLVCPLEYSSNNLIPYLRLTELFHNVQTLKILQFSLSANDLCTIQVLLYHLASSITNLKLAIQIDDPEKEDDDSDDDNDDDNENNDLLNRAVTDGLNSIMYLVSNRMKQLKHLSLDIHTPYLYNQGKIIPDLKVLSTLETLNYYSFGFVNNLDYNEPLREIELYGSNATSLREISIGNKANLNRLLKLSPELARKFTQIKLLDAINLENVEEFTRYCFRFNSLVVLSFQIEHSYWKVIHALTNLHQLIDLSLSIDLKEQNIDAEPKELSQPRLPSVVALSLYITTKSHQQIGALDLPATMPNLQVVLLRHDSSQCTECGYGPFNIRHLTTKERNRYDNPMFVRMHNCMKQARCSLHGLEKLRKLNVNLMPHTVLIVYIGNKSKHDIDLTRDELLNELEGTSWLSSNLTLKNSADLTDK